MLSNIMSNKLYYAFILIPIVNASANVTTNYFPSNTLNPGYLRTLVLLILIIVCYGKYKLSGHIFTLLYIYLGYNLLLVLLNENLMSPLLSYIKLAVSLFMLPIGFIMVKDQESFLLLMKSSIIALFILSINFAISNFYRLGGSAYETSVYIGGSNVGLFSDISFYIICGFNFLMINKTRKWNYFAIVLTVVSAIIVLVSMRRSSIITLFVGMVVYFIYSKYKFKNIKYALISAILLIGFLPYYGSKLIDRYDYRAESRGGSLLKYEREGRYHEIFWVIDDIKKDTKKITIGTHNLDSENYFRMGRGLHGAYINMLHGSGLIGLFLFLWLMFNIFYTEKKLFKRILKQNTEMHIHTLFIALFIALLIHLVTNIIYQFTVTPNCFLLFGAILGFFTRNLRREKRHPVDLRY